MQIPGAQSGRRGYPGSVPCVVIDMGEDGSGGDPDRLPRAASMPNLSHGSGGPLAEEEEDSLPPREAEGDGRGVLCKLCQKCCPPPIRMAMKYMGYGLLGASVCTTGVLSAACGVSGMMVFEGSNLIASCLNKSPRRGLPLVNEVVEHTANTLFTVGNAMVLGMETGIFPQMMSGIPMSQLINAGKCLAMVPFTGIHGCLTHRKPCRNRKECLQKTGGVFSTLGLSLLSGYTVTGSFMQKVPQAVLHGTISPGICLFILGSAVGDLAHCCGGKPSPLAEEDEEAVVPIPLEGRGEDGDDRRPHTPSSSYDVIINTDDGPPEEEEGALMEVVVMA